MNYLILLLPLCFLACNGNPNCPKGSHSAITITNQSSKRIYYQIYWNYPDTAIGQYNPVHNNGILKPGDNAIRTISPNGSKSCWEEILMKSEAENIYFFDADIIENVPWEDVQKNNTGLLERRKVDLEYCKKNDWTIIYR
ncbi:hypothetical protein J2Y45_004692 [Dyadobacter sp. BE34]|uniref:Lipoprotein n=1 Tax=Dyadobacter fermentans TaxID=94254 RepID=A0ABU1R261_9BACT|nr:MULTISPECIES: hypothetical protein [Dyadobacter]MDR6807492.1 hypothetical protein [Dyadobacter fermentans]MDR7045233.1 hypothetical protein [Dyadobacter sp. BE242]MDR7199546.1 hypothetical protein [Dyadobacter sp. BE34]MDR7217995.1 hypothetical protein [Dyadobacter sp. BE31]MDR7265437.1 hypothetical protein [Dyadobacter sp. BE32]